MSDEPRSPAVAKVGETGSALAMGTRFAYGFGLSAEGIKNNSFQVFLLFFYQQIVGLDPRWCGLALFVALWVDAVTDPLVGIWSDGTRSRFGRRHPFMYAASLPLGLCFLMTFRPPEGLGQGGTFLWLLAFAVGTRFSMTLFVIPHQALVPELSTGYEERTSLQTWRTVFAWLFGLFNSLLVYRVFLAATPDFPQGLLNPEGYKPFAVWGAVAMFVSTLLSSLTTQRAALRAAPRIARLPTFSWRRFLPTVREAFRSPSYRAAVLGGLGLWIGFGIAENLNLYLNTFLWGFTSEQISYFILIIMGSSFFVLAITRRLVARVGKRRLAIGAALVPAILRPAVIALRLVGLLPGDGSQGVFLLLAVVAFVDYTAIIVAMTMIADMIGDVTDEHELRNGSRQEGLLYSANTFLIKASTGVGVLVAGFVVSLAGFPEQAARDTVTEQAAWNLGAFAMVILLVFGALNAFFFSRYRLSRQQHAEILTELARRRAAVEGP